ncbi:MAG: prolipoprotein diacylglyceryl transferase [Anaerolinea sp.]|nr:prolipoprotein diacylglyceryl transferase [Anaerolinea sp.]
MAVNSFSLWIGVGAVLGLVLVFWRAPAEQAVQNLCAAFGVLVGALMGARAAFVWAYAAAFANRPQQMWMVWLGGLSGPGAVLGALLMVGLLALLLRRSVWQAADAWLAPLLPPLVVMSWLAAWTAGVAYGAALPSDSLLAVATPPDGSPRWPLQWVAALLCWLLLGAEETSRRRFFAGQRSARMVLTLGWVLLLFSVLRVDPRPMWYGLPYDLWAALAIWLLGVVLFFAAWASWRWQRVLS